jgi:hypothetical protein
MNEQNPEVPPVETTALPFKDRSVGLIVFGSLTIVLGCLTGLLVPVMLVGQAAAARNTNGPHANFSVILPAIFIYGVLAVALVWLGIGSIMARRWARALLLIFSWSWLVMGVFMVIVMAFVIPKMLAGISGAPDTNHQLPASTMAGVMLVIFLVFGVLFVILPAVWTFFYNSCHVKATCETRDPEMRWTDACPLPVLGLCLWLLFSVPWMLFMPLTGHAVIPCFGIFVTGLPGALFYLAIAALWSYAAWLLYQLDLLGWWLILIALVLFTVSSLLTYAQHDVTEMYQLMGYPHAQIREMQRLGLLTGNRMIWLTLFSMLPFLGYLFFIKKYLHDR